MDIIPSCESPPFSAWIFVLVLLILVNILDGAPSGRAGVVLGRVGLAAAAALAAAVVVLRRRLVVVVVIVVVVVRRLGSRLFSCQDFSDGVAGVRLRVDDFCQRLQELVRLVRILVDIWNQKISSDWMNFFISSMLPAFLLLVLRLHFRAEWLPMIGARQPSGLYYWSLLTAAYPTGEDLNSMRAEPVE